jgi:hypothetical protein
MKRKFLYASVFILMIPFYLTSAQDKKGEQKIKIVVNDGSGSKVVMDTTFSDNTGPDSLKLKDGSVVYMKHPYKGKDHIFVTYSSDGKNRGKEYREVTVIRSDSAHGSNDNDNVTYYSNSSSNSSSTSNSFEGNHNKKYRIITRNFNDSDNIENDSTVNRTKYVIAKDGMVVTVEGNDEAKAKELVKEIESKLGVNDENVKKKK